MPDDTQTYFRSEHPQVREWWEEHRRRIDAFTAAAEALEAEFPGHSCAVAQYLGKEWVVGLLGKECPGPLWQKRQGEPYWSPRLRMKEGRALNERVDGIGYDPPRIPGMPATIQGSRCRHSPGFNRYGEVYWVAWAVEAAEVEKSDRFDPLIWQRARASEYWLAKERAEEPATEAARGHQGVTDDGAGY